MNSGRHFDESPWITFGVPREPGRGSPNKKFMIVVFPVKQCGFFSENITPDK